MAALALVCAGCASPRSSDAQEGFTDAAGYEAEYRQAVESFGEEMPEGVGFPVDPPPTSPGADIGVGLGTGMVYFHWNCAWMDVYLHSDDDAERSAAMAQLRTFPDTEYAQEYVEDPEGLYDSWLDEAELGSPTSLSELYETDCGTDYEEYMRTLEDRP